MHTDLFQRDLVWRYLKWLPIICAGEGRREWICWVWWSKMAFVAVTCLDIFV